MPKLPKRDEITFRWLIDHIPILWWVYVIVALTSVFSIGIGVGRISFQDLDGDIRSKLAIRDKLQSDIQELSTQKATLKAEIVTLEVEKEVKQMSPEQRREALKKWTRD